jgi:glycerophosphoryl diester phosphodiesterase
MPDVPVRAGPGGSSWIDGTELSPASTFRVTMNNFLLRCGRRTGAVGPCALLAVATLMVGIAPAARAADDGRANPWLGRRVLAIAHAGGELEAPHETLFAYRQAVASGAEVLEGDVRLSADGVLVVHHDERVDTTTDGTGNVRDLTYAQLFALDHAYRYVPYAADCSDCPEADYIYRGVRTGDRPPPAGHTADEFVIPRARDLFERFGDRFLNLEIEGTGDEARRAADALIALVTEFQAEARVVIVSFDDATVDHVRTRLPDAALSPGRDRATAWFGDRQPLPGFSILQLPPTVGGIPVVTAPLVKDAHAVGLAVWVWMDSPDQETAGFYRSLLDMGVDGLIAARPAVARQTIDAAALTWSPVGSPVQEPGATVPPAEPIDTRPSPDDGGSAPGPAPVPMTPRFTG